MPLSGRSFADAEMGAFKAPTADSTVRVAVVADPHLCVDETAYDKLHKPNTMFQRAIADINSRDIDYTLSVGDLTREGVEAEYDVFDSVLEDLETPFVAIPGNHDVPNDFDDHGGVTSRAFRDRYTMGNLPFVCEVGDQHFVGLDTASASAVSNSHDGYVPQSQVSWLDETLEGLEDPVVLLHHNLPDAIDQFDAYREATDPSLGTPPILREPDELVGVLADHDVPLVLSGHLHIPGYATTAGVREILVPSTCTFPQAYLVLEIDQTGTTVNFVPVGTQSEARTAYHQRIELKPKAQALTAMAATRLSLFPLVHEDESIDS